MIGVRVFDELLRIQHEPRPRPHTLIVSLADLHDVCQLVAAAGLAYRVRVNGSDLVRPGQMYCGDWDQL